MDKPVRELNSPVFMNDDELYVAYEELREENARLRDLVKHSRIALADVFRLTDENILVRNTDDDDKPDYTFRMLAVIERLKYLHDVLEKLNAEIGGNGG